MRRNYGKNSLVTLIITDQEELSDMFCNRGTCIMIAAFIQIPRVHYSIESYIYKTYCTVDGHHAVDQLSVSINVFFTQVKL